MTLTSVRRREAAGSRQLNAFAFLCVCAGTPAHTKSLKSRHLILTSLPPEKRAGHREEKNIHSRLTVCVHARRRISEKTSSSLLRHVRAGTPVHTRNSENSPKPHERNEALGIVGPCAKPSTPAPYQWTPRASSHRSWTCHFVDDLRGYTPSQRYLRDSECLREATVNGGFSSYPSSTALVTAQHISCAAPRQPSIGHHQGHRDHLLNKLVFNQSSVAHT